MKLMQSLICIALLSAICTSAYTQTKSIPLFVRDRAEENRWKGLRSNRPATVIKYDAVVYDQLKQSRLNQFELTIPAPDESLLNIKLVKSEIFADEFKVMTDKENNIPFTPGLYYHGEIEGQPGSIVSIALQDDEVAGMINTQDGHNYVIGSSSAIKKSSFIIFDANQGDKPSSDCFAELLPNYKEKANLAQIKKIEQRVAGGCVNIYYELGNSVYTNKGGTTQATTYITNVFTMVNALYAADGVTVKLGTVFVWTTPEPYAADASTALTDFGKRIQNNLQGNNLAQMVRLKTGGSMSGIAWVDVLCDPFWSPSSSGPYSYAEVLPTYSSVPTFSWTVEVLTHEMGHNLGSPHTQSCSWPGGPIDNCVSPEGSCTPGPTPTNGGTIMSYCHLTSIGINFNNGFGPLPKALIQNRVSAATCVVACSSTPPPCSAPTGLNTPILSSGNARLAWTAVSGAVSYSVDYKLATSSTWTNAVTGTTGTQVDITGLTPSSSYQWQVRTNCSGGASSYSQSSFITLAAPVTCISSPPAGLNTNNILSNSANISWTASSGATGYNVQYKQNSSSTWLIAASNTTATTVTLGNLVAATLYDWQVQAVCSAGASSFVLSQFTTASSSTTCVSTPPTGLSSSVTTTGATVSWTALANASSYTVNYKLPSTSTWTLAGSPTTNSLTISGLQSGTLYDWQVRANCNAGSSAYTNSQLSTASVSVCNAPTALTASNITNTTVTLSYTASAFNYTVEIKPSTSSTWISLITTSALAINVSGLSASTTYDWRVKSNCTSGTSGYTQAQFTTTGTTTPTCGTPTGLTVSGITTSAANLSWTAANGAVNYSIEYKLSTSTNFTIANAALAGTSFTLSGLTANTVYNWRVKTNCSTTSSAYATGQFTTSAVASSSCPGPADLTIHNSLSTAVSISKNTVYKGTISTSTDNDYYKFDVSLAGTFSITVTTLPADYDVRVYNSSGSTIGLSQNAGTTNETVSISLAPGTYYVRIYGWNGANSPTSCYTLNVQAVTGAFPSGIAFLSKNLSTSIFPNPANQYLHYNIDGLYGMAKVTITDLQGRVMQYTESKSYENEMNVSQLNSGMYLLNISDEYQRRNVIKFIKL